MCIRDRFGRSLPTPQQANPGYGVLVAFGPGMIAEVALVKSKNETATS